MVVYMEPLGIRSQAKRRAQGVRANVATAFDTAPGKPGAYLEVPLRVPLKGSIGIL